MIAGAVAVALAAVSGAWAFAPAPVAATGPVAATAAPPDPAHRTARYVATEFGTRPAGSVAERRMHAYAARRFEAAGLRVSTEGFGLPRGGRSRNVLGIRDTPARCLDVVMAHGDSARVGRGALDNASGVGLVLSLADAPGATRCDVWFVVTGAEERIVTRSPDHLGAAALVRRVRRLGRARDLRLALSLDEVGRGTSFTLRSSARGPRPAVEGRVLDAALRREVGVRWSPDVGTGNSDHREFGLAGLPGAVLQVRDGVHPCRHRACDQPGQLQSGAFRRVRAVVRSLLAR